MTIQTKYNIGDCIMVNGEARKIVSAHIYDSEKKHTERYFIGNHEFITVIREKKTNGKDRE